MLTTRTFLYKLTVSALAFAAGVLTARVLSKADRADFQLTTTIMLLGQTYLNGFSVFHAFALAKRPEKGVAITRAGNPLMVLSAACIWLSTWTMAWWFTGRIPHSLFWAGPVLALAALFGYASSLLQGSGVIVQLNRANTLQSLTFVLFYPCALYLPKSGVDLLSRTYGAWLASWVVAAGVGLWIAYRCIGPGAWRWRWDRNHAQRLFHYGAWQSVCNLVNYANYRVDFWLVAALAGATAAADYAIAVTAGEVLVQISGSIVQVVYRRLAGRDRQDAVQIVELSSRHTLITASCAAFGLSLVYPWFIPAVFGHRYMDAVLPALVLLPGFVAKAANNVILQFTIHQLGQPRTAIWMNGLCLTTNVVCGWLWIPAHGLLGAASASTLSYLLSYAVSVYWFCSVNHSHPGRLYRVSAEDLSPYRQLWRLVRRFPDNEG
ncbi:lipopolysaccharide biosynthesis protein [Alicyclobacillus herbarius]|uniref:lipopolysaccharide biosynthesis protein n=1 Tax=Alicyclobacillus herbarius TaxID=122960 RepID=UPI0003FCCEAF|nr:oligosaccharide flippase family protein [Alicyclobacillus herbarius]